LIESKEATVDRAGTAKAEFMLTRALMQKAMQGEIDPQKLEFYVTVEYYAHKKHATINVNVDNPQNTSPRPQPRPQQPANTPTQTPQQPSTPPRAENSPAAEKPASQKEEKGIMDTVTDWWNNLELWDWREAKGTIEPQQPPTTPADGGRTVSVVQDSSVEDVIDVYFAKKEFTKQTGEVAGTFEYTIGSNGNRTSTDAEKTHIANIILGKPNVKGLVSKKEYTTLEAIKAGLTKEIYNKDEKVTFQTFKLGEEFKKVGSAALDSKLYLVAKTSGLNGKQATIIIKEKDGLIKGSPDAVLPVLEITEAQMEAATPTTGEVPGTEKTEFTGTIENGMVKIPIHLRPKSNDELTQWKEKLTKGKEDGTYTYKFGGPNVIANEDDKKRIAGIILNNAKKGNTNNTKIEDGKTAHLDEIVKVLEVKSYAAGNTVTFKLHKKEKELLYLNVKAQGDKQHDKNFLKAEGAYFVLGKNCFCNRDITITEFESILKKLRESEKVSNTNSVFYADNCNVDDKTNAGLLAQLNKVFKDYEINTCIRKIHFLSQVYHESDKFQTTLEYANGSKYDPGVHNDAIGNGNTVAGDGERYKGKGLMQLTWKNNYSKYKAYSSEDVVTSPLRVAEELELAVDSAAWFWTQGKVLNNSTEWTVPTTSYSTYDGSAGKKFPKTQISHTTPSGTVAYGTINMNLLADKDYIDTISWLVNGGGNGRQERRDYLKEIKKIFGYPEDCANTQATTGNVAIRLTRKWQTDNSTIGEFTIDNSTITGYILEEKGPDTTVSGMEQRVPIGTYKLEWHSGTKFAKALKLSNDVVSVSRAILIHAGNTAADTEGCLLPGSTKNTDFVGGSKDKLKEIFDFVEEQGIEGAQIIITEAYE